MIEEKEVIKLFYDNETKLKTISLNTEERFIKNFKDLGINSTVIEIIPRDEISKDYFLLPTIDYVNDFKELQNEEIFAIQFPKGIFNYSTGKIEEIDKYEFTYSINTKINIEGNPIFLKGSTKVIGIIKAQNKNETKADFIGPIFNFFQNFKEKAKTLEEKSDEPIERSSDTEEINEISSKKDKEEIIEYENGNYYKGETKDGKREGKGTEYYQNGNILYEGSWVNDEKEGFGKFFHEDGYYYEGQFKNRMRHGKGKRFDKNGRLIYEGDWTDDKVEGNGKLIYDNGYYYIGQFKNFKRHGKGIEYYEEGTLMIEAEWVDGAPHGYGKFINEEGERYEGQYKEGLKHGKGKLYDKNGELIYEGDWTDDVKEGNGKFIIPENGLYYIGQFKDDTANGKGKKYDKNGKLLYEGDFVNGFEEGNGKYFYENGDYYIGQFKDGYRHGEGKEYDKNGVLLRWVTYENDEEIRSAELGGGLLED